jgi:hypothetical protein
VQTRDNSNRYRARRDTRKQERWLKGRRSENKQIEKREESGCDARQKRDDGTCSLVWRVLLGFEPTAFLFFSANPQFTFCTYPEGEH